ncbi:MAG: hypothetical protein F6K58_30300 [Symploca sp. SIO2E9]|nr:hypothetical protein [Symploca sp. SIO2E9]
MSQVHLVEGRGGDGERGRWGEGEMGRNYSYGLTLFQELSKLYFIKRENCY